MMANSSKIIGIGFHKTGTSTLRSAMEILGYKVLGPRTDLVQFVMDGDWEKIYAAADPYDVLEDNPWAVIYPQLDERYPDSKFIITLRSDEKWINSVVNHFGGQSTRMREHIYGKGKGDPLGHEDHYLNVYRKHNAEVETYFANRPRDLLSVSWEAGDGWEVICPFLGAEIPTKTFPHVNKGAYTGRQKLIRKTKKFIRKRFLK